MDNATKAGVLGHFWTQTIISSRGTFSMDLDIRRVDAGGKDSNFSAHPCMCAKVWVKTSRLRKRQGFFCILPFIYQSGAFKKLLLVNRHIEFLDDFMSHKSKVSMDQIINFVFINKKLISWKNMLWVQYWINLKLKLHSKLWMHFLKIIMLTVL